LFRVILDRDGDCFGQRATVCRDADFQFAGQGVERDAEQREPAATLLDDRQRLVAPQGARRAGVARAEVDDRHAARHRRMPGQGVHAEGERQEQAADQVFHAAIRLAHHKRRRRPISLV